MNIKDLVNLPAWKLKRIVALKTKIERLQTQVENLATSALPGPIGKVVTTKRKMSAAARRKISLAAKARWARFHAGKGK
jgi:hypothetical protein